MNQRSPCPDSLVLSYLQLRKAVGIIGVALPFVVALGKIVLQGPGIQHSISAYYYTDMGNVFVGSLCAIGVFLMSTRGYDKRDRIAGYIACILAIGVALFPEAHAGATSQQKTIGMLHWTLAALLFLTLAYFSLFLFTETNPEKKPTDQKLQRNKVYRACGYTILGSILLIFVLTRPQIETHVESLTPVFWLESLAVVAFGVAWLIKGETILKDKPA